MAETRREITDETGNPEIGVQIAEFTLLDEGRRLAERLFAAESEIHALINNAGALYPARGLTDEGIERTLALDLLCPFLLTNLLIPRLKASQPARILNVSSGGMYTQRIRVDDLQSEKGRYNGSVAYARAKRGLVILTELWAENLKDKGVVVHSMHPGWADTPGVSSSLPSFYRVTKKILLHRERVPTPSYGWRYPARPLPRRAASGSTANPTRLISFPVRVSRRRNEKRYGRN